MYLRKCYREKEGRRYAYWQLVESYRTLRGPRPRLVAYLGDWEETVREGLRQAAGGRCGDDQRRLFAEATVAPEWVEVDLWRVRVERSRAFGGAWLGLQLVEKLGLQAFFAEVMEPGREEVPWSAMALVSIRSRFCEPSSELDIAEHFYERSPDVSGSDLLGVPSDKVNDDRLYRALDQILPHKERVEIHLKERLGELFELEYDLLL